VTLTGFLGTPASAFGVAAPQLLLPALAAAVIGRMRNLPVTVAASVGIAVVTTTLSFQRPEWAPFVDGLLFVVVVAGLLLQRERRQRSEKGVTASWKATEELRAIPKELLGIGAVRLTRRLLIAAAVVFVVVWPFVASTDETVLGQVIALNAIVGLSLVILTGWAGQVSLGQFGLVAIGALVAGSLSTRLGFPFWIAVPLATVLTAAVATAIGVPGLRIPGLFLAVATFAFAVAVRAVLFTDSFSWLQPNGRIHRPSLLMIDFEDEKSMYFLCAVALIVACVAVVNLRRSRFGRVLIAVRENDANAAAAGIDPTRLKLMAFAVAGALAGFSGALLAFQGRGVTGSSFDPQASIDIFVQVVLGGVSTVAGALLGSGFWNVTHQLLAQFPDLQLALGPAAALVLLYISPGGIVAMVTRVRDAALRIVAMRNQIIVPSLFADIDPAALEARLIPMAPPDDRQGLDDIAARYRLRTRLFDTSRARMKSQVEVTRA
jgi:branched-chain amino acid transport system permease protein